MKNKTAGLKLYSDYHEFSKFILINLNEMDINPILFHKKYDFFDKWLTNTFYENPAHEKFGVTTIEFEIGKKGKPENIRIIQSDNPEFSRAVYNILTASPKWKNKKKIIFYYRLHLQL
ncbi:MAG: energy transducer TonB [Rikenellaceae bacterium]|nr:energy transducer TonB [Rikenellaceae bacterium]